MMISDDDRDDGISQNLTGGPFIEQPTFRHLHVRNISAAETTRVAQQPTEILNILDRELHSHDCNAGSRLRLERSPVVRHPPLDEKTAIVEASLSLAARTFSLENLARQIGEKMDLAVDIAPRKRKKIERVGLTWHAIDRKIPNHLDTPVFSLMRM